MQAKDDAAASSNTVAAGSSSHIDDEMERALVDFLLNLKRPAHLVWGTMPLLWISSCSLACKSHKLGSGVTGLQMQQPTLSCGECPAQALNCLSLCRQRLV